MTDWQQMLDKRNDLNERLYQSLKHLTTSHIVAIIAGWIDINTLDKLVKAQERATKEENK